jgi:allophanate hydrolase subunit 1
VDFDPKTLTTPQLTACVRELWKRIQAKDQEKREAELALANEPPGQAA